MMLPGLLLFVTIARPYAPCGLASPRWYAMVREESAMGRAAASGAGNESGASAAAEASALEALRLDWGSAWDIGRGGTRWHAALRDRNGPVLTRASAAGLAMALRISYGRPR